MSFGSIVVITETIGLPEVPPFKFVDDGAGNLFFTEAPDNKHSRTSIETTNDNDNSIWTSVVDVYAENADATNSAEWRLGSSVQPGEGAAVTLSALMADGSGLKYKSTSDATNSVLEIWPTPSQGNGLLFYTHKEDNSTGFGIQADGQIRTGNSVAATVPGTVAKKLEIFDANGASLGFIPIYDAIT